MGRHGHGASLSEVGIEAMTTPSLRAATIDGTARWSCAQYSSRWHICAEGSRSACGECGLNDNALTVDAATVPLVDRCQRSGCRQRWPKEVLAGGLARIAPLPEPF